MRWWFRRSGKLRDQGPQRIEKRVCLDGYGELDVHVQIGCLGAVCPRPQMLTMRALDHMQDGEVLELTVDNPSSAEAIPAMGMALESDYLVTVREEDCWRIYMRKGYQNRTE